MAESKKTGGGKKPVSQTREEAAEALRKAAELISSLNDNGDAKPAAKKTSAKKPAAKKTTAASTAKTSAAKKPAASKSSATKKTSASSAKKPAAKKQAENKPIDPQTEQETAAVDSGVEEQSVSVVEPVPVEQEQVAVASSAVEQQPTAIEEAPAQAEEQPPQAVESAPAPASTDEQNSEQVAPVAAAEQPRAQKAGFKQKAKSAVDNGNIITFIVANALLGLSAVLLLISAFDVTYYIGETSVTEWYSFFGYFKHASEIQARLDGVAFGWAKGGYATIGILMALSVLAPLALIAKNVILLIKNKDKRVGAIDAAVSLAFIVAYIGVVNLFGANVTAGHISALTVAIILAAFAVFASVLRGASIGATAFAASNIALTVLCMFLLTASPVYNQAGWYAAATASVDGGASVAFILLLAAVAAFAAIIVIRVQKLPAILNIVVPSVAGVAALIALILFGMRMPDGFALDAGFAIGAILTFALAAVDVLFAVIPPLKKLIGGVTDKKSEQPQSATVENVPATAAVENDAQPANVENAAQPQTAQNEKRAIFCPSCGAENESDSAFCLKCGKRL
ncbi:zinc-ribbon domain-containing protein [Anaerocaecibacter muris]|uniref:zinc ribbon domain-containing protein n=1 Tax=Anaerocaecibacter muris TaxID=2941513 RepID=UPI003F68EE0A